MNAPKGVVPDPPRLDAYLTANIPDISRGRIVSSIKEGLVDVNGKLVKKPSYKVWGMVQSKSFCARLTHRLKGVWFQRGIPVRG